MNSLSWLLNKGMIANIEITRMNHKVDSCPQLVVASKILIYIIIYGLFRYVLILNAFGRSRAHWNRLAPQMNTCWAPARIVGAARPQCAKMCFLLHKHTPS